MNALRAGHDTRGLTAMRAIIAIAIALAACGDGLPSRPDEAKFHASSMTERCRLTAARAIMCTDELIVAELRAIDGGGGELADVVEQDITADNRLPKQSRKQNIEVHKTSCLANPGYAEAVFRCWSQANCKQFATCVHAWPPAGSAAPSGSAAPAGRAAPADTTAPAGSALRLP